MDTSEASSPFQALCSSIPEMVARELSNHSPDVPVNEKDLNVEDKRDCATTLYSLVASQLVAAAQKIERRSMRNGSAFDLGPFEENILWYLQQLNEAPTEDIVHLLPPVCCVYVSKQSTRTCILPPRGIVGDLQEDPVAHRGTLVQKRLLGAQTWEYHSLGLALRFGRNWFYLYGGMMSQFPIDCEYDHNRLATVITAGMLNGSILPGFYHVYGPVLLCSEEDRDIFLDEFTRFYDLVFNGVGSHCLHAATDHGGSVDWARLRRLDDEHHSFEVPDVNVDDNRDLHRRSDWEEIHWLYHVTGQKQAIIDAGRLIAYKADDSSYDKSLVKDKSPSGVFFTATLFNGDVPKQTVYPRSAKPGSKQDMLLLPVSFLNQCTLFLVLVSEGRGQTLLLAVPTGCPFPDNCWPHDNIQQLPAHNNNFLKQEDGRWWCRKTAKGAQQVTNIFVLGDVSLTDAVEWRTVRKF